MRCEWHDPAHDGANKNIAGLHEIQLLPCGDTSLKKSFFSPKRWLITDYSKQHHMFQRFFRKPFRNWFKGADTVCILAFLEARIREALDNLEGDSKTYFREIFKMIAAANSFMRCIYYGALFLSSEERNHLLKTGYQCIDAYHKCAQHAYDMQVTRWKYMPKFHMYGELLYKLYMEKVHDLPSCNPLAFCTQQDEDFVGRVSVISRSVSIRTVHTRTLTRYLSSLASHW